MQRCYIGLGSNLASPHQQLVAAIAALAQLKQCQIFAVSGLYASKPMGPQDQPDYLNAVLSLDTTLTPLALLDATQHIEQNQGRVRKAQRWGPRTLDLDILLFGQETLDLPRLTVPHYGLEQREFVLIPLAEIAPELVLPNGKSVRELATRIPTNRLYCSLSAKQWVNGTSAAFIDN
ncbi:2-amino-4-hydroxy-6-hydroxymethyldihydropteridine diphosphokinase [Celerinatantimonas yamalensis]|uniref:2-amino-4-hydroxy-6-hydroxymethyldihydropteridine pyrophosphokinase n=1 Tax=Celerinatantimonas yamalensis TaxID=559956 RepID=A0ABW9GB49_9GAMM